MNRKTERTDQSVDTVVAVGAVAFGADPFPVIAGPCAVESEEQINHVAEAVAQHGAAVLRGGTVASASSPYAFGGLGGTGVRMLAEAGRAVGLPVVTQVDEPRQVGELADLVDMLEISAANMQNFELLRVAGQTKKPILLKRASSATIDEWLWAAEYVLAEGNDQVVMCERGIRTFGDGPTLDITSVAIVQERSHLPVIVLPSHAAGSRSRVIPLSLAAEGIGANGLAVEVHPHPDRAATNQDQQLDPEGFAELMVALGVNRMRGNIDAVDQDIIRLLAERQRLAVEIGRMKAERGRPIRSPDREAELLELIRRDAKRLGVRTAFAIELFERILEESRAVQRLDRQGGD